MRFSDEMTKTNGIPELLAPAGSPDALRAAVDAGADAVYFGTEKYNARQRAGNFDGTAITESIKTLKSYGVKSYITVNTQLRNDELRDAEDMIIRLWNCGADAFIISDAGLAALLHSEAREIELHASTQMSAYSEYDAAYLEKAGFSRMVCPRELSGKQIVSLCHKSPIDIEMFVHGAHCVSFSGQCMLSYAMGGRSGNRGTCAQPCRLPFSSDGCESDHVLSLKDMCLAEIGRAHV